MTASFPTCGCANGVSCTASCMPLIAEMGWRSNEKAARYEEIHRALLAGLLGNIGFKSEEAGIYLGARQIKFVLSPASGLKKKPPKWVMAAELTETTRLYARCVAAIEPEWIERLGLHLAKRSYREPHWSKDSGSVVAYEQVTVYGLVVVQKRRVQYGPIEPKQARELFIRGALVANHYPGQPDFLEHNRRLIEDVQQLEHKSRRHDVLVDDEAIFAFYAERIPEGIHSAVDFEKWRRTAERRNPKLLFLGREYLMRHAAEQITEELFPDALTVGMQTFDLSYRFDPGHALDGVTMIVPLHLLNQLDERRCEWLVAGLLRDKITYLLKGLPKTLRKHFVPVPQVVTASIEVLDPDIGPLTDALSQALFKKTGVDVPVDAWDVADLPPHLLMNFSVVDEAVRRSRAGGTLPLLRNQLGVKARRTFSETASTAFERKGSVDLGFRRTARTSGSGPRQGKAHRLSGYRRRGQIGRPHAAGYGTRSRRSDSPRSAPPVPACAAGTDEVPGPQPSRLQRDATALCAAGRTASGKPDKSAVADRLRDELVTAICDRAFFVEQEPIRNRKQFEVRAAKGKTRLMDVAQEICRIAGEILTEQQTLRAKIGQPQYAAWPRALADIRAQLKELLPSGFLAGIPFERLKHYPRYISAIAVRLDKIASNPERDANWQQQLARYWQTYQARLVADRARGVRARSWRICAGCSKSCGCRSGRSS